MNESEIIVSVKVVVTKTGQPWYYERFGDDSHWQRIDKDRYDWNVKENKNYALELEQDEKGEVKFLRYKLDNERSWAKLGIKPTNTQHTDQEGNTIVTLGFEKIEGKKPKGCAPMAAAFLLAIIIALLLL